MIAAVVSAVVAEEMLNLPLVVVIIVLVKTVKVVMVVDLAAVLVGVSL